jgi:hypothetical protein
MTQGGNLQAMVRVIGDRIAHAPFVGRLTGD